MSVDGFNDYLNFFRVFDLGDCLRLKITLVFMEVLVILSDSKQRDFAVDVKTFFRLKRWSTQQTDFVLFFHEADRVDGRVFSVVGLRKLVAEVYSFYKLNCSTISTNEDNVQTFELSTQCLDRLMSDLDRICHHVFRLTSQIRVIENCTRLVRQVFQQRLQQDSSAAPKKIRARFGDHNHVLELHAAYTRMFPDQLPTGTVSLNTFISLVVADIKKNRIHIC